MCGCVYVCVSECALVVEIEAKSGMVVWWYGGSIENLTRRKLVLYSSHSHINSTNRSESRKSNSPRVGIVIPSVERDAKCVSRSDCCPK